MCVDEFNILAITPTDGLWILSQVPIGDRSKQISLIGKFDKARKFSGYLVFES